MTERKTGSSSTGSNRNLPKFEEGEKILCYHGSLIYEAKCLKVDMGRSNDRFYFVHYNGWNKNWDEWVNTKRILKFNTENLKKQQELIVASRYSTKELKNKAKKDSSDVQQKFETTQNQSKRKKTNEETSASLQLSDDSSSKTIDTTKKRKIYSIDIYSKHNKYLTNSKIRIQIPLNLKDWLVDDFDAIMRQNKLLKLPCPKPIKEVLNDYVVFKNNNEKLSQTKKSDLDETVTGLIRYFNAMIGSQLLYKFERIQYSELLEKNKPMSEIYGAIHFLRLIEKLEQIILYAPLEASPLENLLAHVNDILDYLDRFCSDLFSTDLYVNATPNYIRELFN